MCSAAIWGHNWGHIANLHESISCIINVLHAQYECWYSVSIGACHASRGQNVTYCMHDWRMPAYDHAARARGGCWATSLRRAVLGGGGGQNMPQPRL